MGIENMNLYELYEALLGVAGCFENFFKNAGSVPLFLLHFASYASYFQLCEIGRLVLSGSSAYFMNFMKIYVGGIFNGFFGFGSVFPAMDMKLGFWFASYNFINALPPLPFGHLPQMGERNLGEDGIGGVL